MPIFRQFYDGCKSYIKATELVFSSSLWVYLLYPLAMYIVIYLMGIIFLNGLVSKIPGFFASLVLSESSPEIMKNLINAFFYIFSFLLRMYVFFFTATLSKYIVLIIMSPVMAVLSMRTEKIITGTNYSVSRRQFFQNIVRGILIALRNMALQLSLIIISFVVIWIPVIGWVFPIFILILSYYFYGFSMIDYVSERRNRNVSQSIKYVRSNKGMVIGNGFVFSLLFNIPIVGLILSTVISPVAACIAVLEAESQTKTIV
jgi:CysZ protein